MTDDYWEKGGVEKLEGGHGTLETVALQGMLDGRIGTTFFLRFLSALVQLLWSETLYEDTVNVTGATIEAGENDIKENSLAGKPC
jgi:hypothetical protein